MRYSNKEHISIPLVYGIAGCCWIFFSDALLLGRAVSDDILSISTFKGLGFVAVTACILYVLLLRRHQLLMAHQQKLQEQSEFQRAITLASPLPLYTLTPEGTVTYWNPAAERIFGWTSDEVLGWPLPIVPDFARDTFAETLGRTLQGHIFSGFELQRQHKNGSLIDVSLSSAPILDNEKRPIGVMAILENITEKKEAEKTIFKLNRLYTVLSEVNQAIVRIRDLQELFDTACRIAVKDGGFCMTWICLLDKESGKVHKTAAYGLDDGFLDAAHNKADLASAGQGPVYTALREGKHDVVHDVAADPRTAERREEAVKRGYRSSAAFPIAPLGEVRGAAVFYSEEPYFFDAAEIRLLDELAMDLSMAMEIIEHEEMRLQAETRLKESESRYRSLFESNHAVMLLVDPEEGRIVDANPAACDYYGWSRSTLKRLAVWDINTLDAAAVKEKMAAALFAGERRFLFQHRRADGSVRDVEVYSGSILLEERNLLYSIVFDVTERIRAENALIEAKERAETANKAKTEFLTNMSHELRTPLNGVLGMLHLIRTTGLNSVQEEYAAAAVHSSKRLTDLLSSILDMSQLESGSLTITAAPFDPRDAIREATELFKSAAKQSKLELRSRCDPNAPREVIGDKPRLMQVLTNFVGNALKFTQSGGVTLEATALSPVEPETCRLLFSISDTGPGIADDILKNLFEPFIQGSQGFRREHQGAGLGLALNKRIISLMGGHIAVETQKGVGTAIHFSLSFPLPEAEEELEAANEPHAVATSPLRVLVVEDDMVNRLSLTRLLEKHSIAVDAVGDGRQALELLRSTDFSVVLMDIQMPVMDGLEAATAIRNGETGEQNVNIPIVALTAYATEKDRQRFLQAGMNDYLSKPVEVDDVLRIVLRNASQPKTA